jgi:hypothetical protein
MKNLLKEYKKLKTSCLELIKYNLSANYQPYLTIIILTERIRLGATLTENGFIL